MMAVRHYTRDELLALRTSPLVQKPENLPAIEQWLDEASSSSAQTAAQQSAAGGGNLKRQGLSANKTGGESSPMGNFSTGLRPTLTRGARTGDDVSLGPPRTTFPSSRNVSKLSDFGGDKVAGEGVTGEETEGQRRGIFADRGNRKSMNDREGRDMRDSWTTVRDRRQAAGDDGGGGRHNRRDREHDNERRTGESRWGSRDERRQGDRTSWRDREREKKDRDWGRGDAHQEKEPEWMDAPLGPEDDLRTMGIPQNQEEFQRWKELQKRSVDQAEERVEEPPPVKETVQPKTTAALKLEGFTDKPFGGWADAKSLPAGTLDGIISSAKAAPSKGKASRFASMFNQPKDEPVPEPPLQTHNNGSNGSAEDAAGFQRIMAMLDKTTISPAFQSEGPTSPSARAVSNGTRQKSRFTGFFDQTPKSPERVQTLPEATHRPNESDMFQSQRSFTDGPGMFGGRLPETRAGEQGSRNPMASNPMSPEPMPPPSHQRSNDVFLEQPPSRGTATPDLNIQNLLASQRALRPGGQDKNSAFLLDLLQTKGSSRPSSQARPDSNFPLWVDQPPNLPETHAPQPRAPPPPGLFEDQLLHNNASQDASKQEISQTMSGQDMPQRRTSQRAPPGFYDDQNLFMQQQQQSQAAQRRNFEPPPQQLPQGARRMSGHPNLPPMQMPGMQQHFPPGPPQLPDFMQSPPGGPPSQGPPPGFNPHMSRHPPGIHSMPNIFQGPQQHQPQGRDPPGFAGMPPGAMQPQPGMQSPPNAPPGFFGGPPGLPPGYMQMRSPNEPMPSGGPPGMRGGRPFDNGFDGGGQRR